ncbi:sigma-70 family RNA polymerase sigma factor [Sorangium sp. So ce119]|uniref:RNA polymerase sigma factor n=1 Tax=Sorangium sp. So ce119 TaxID=3133279 RepID=UPI003F633F9E
MEDPMTPDDTVLTAAARGDDGALELLVRAYHDRVYRFGLRACRDAFDADDAVQEAFTKLARRPDVARDPGALSWLMTVVRNACLRMLRPFARERARASRGARLDDADAAPSAELDPHAALERWRLVRAVHEAIAALERPYREVLVLRDVEGMTGEEVCQALGLGEAAMKSRLHRARQLVRGEILRREGAPRARSAREGG